MKLLHTVVIVTLSGLNRVVADSCGDGTIPFVLGEKDHAILNDEKDTYLNNYWRKRFNNGKDVSITALKDTDTMEAGYKIGWKIINSTDPVEVVGIGAANNTLDHYTDDDEGLIQGSEGLLIQFASAIVTNVTVGVILFNPDEKLRWKAILNNKIVQEDSVSGTQLVSRDPNGEVQFDIHVAGGFEELVLGVESRNPYTEYLLEYIEGCYYEYRGVANSCGDDTIPFVLGEKDHAILNDEGEKANYLKNYWRKRFNNGKDVSITALKDTDTMEAGYKIGWKIINSTDPVEVVGIGAANNTLDHYTDDDEGLIQGSEGLLIQFASAIVTNVTVGVILFNPDEKLRWKAILNDEIVQEDSVSGTQGLVSGTQLVSRDPDGEVQFDIHVAGGFEELVLGVESRNPYTEYLLEYIEGCVTGVSAYIAGDPHIKTWGGDNYDFHGVCDLLLLKNPDFKEGLGMDIQVRSKKYNQWAYISSAVLRIGKDTLEVSGRRDEHGNSFWINGVAADSYDISKVAKEEKTVLLPQTISGHPITLTWVSDKKREFEVGLGKNQQVVMKAWNNFVRVDLVGARASDFGGSLGLMGKFPNGFKVARDGNTIMNDSNEFGMEWQVLDTESGLFHNTEGPQAPEKCAIPVTTTIRRRLRESIISHEEAKEACSHVTVHDLDICIFDVMATNDIETAGAY